MSVHIVDFNQPYGSEDVGNLSEEEANALGQRLAQVAERRSNVEEEDEYRLDDSIEKYGEDWLDDVVGQNLDDSDDWRSNESVAHESADIFGFD